MKASGKTVKKLVRAARPKQPAPLWHDPEELRDRLNQPRVTYEEALAQVQRTMSQPTSETPVPNAK